MIRRKSVVRRVATIVRAEATAAVDLIVIARDIVLRATPATTSKVAAVRRRAEIAVAVAKTIRRFDLRRKPIRASLLRGEKAVAQRRGDFCPRHVDAVALRVIRLGPSKSPIVFPSYLSRTMSQPPSKPR